MNQFNKDYVGVTVECTQRYWFRFQYTRVARPEGFEPPTFGFEVHRSIR
jgi:hypothetical protein